MLAGIQSIHGDEAVCTVGRADVNHVDVLFLEQIAVVGVNACIGRAVLLGGILCALHDQVTESDHFHIAQLGE